MNDDWSIFTHLTARSATSPTKMLLRHVSAVRRATPNAYAIARSSAYVGANNSRLLFTARGRVFSPTEDEAWMKNPHDAKLQQFLKHEHAYLSQLLHKERFRRIERTLYSEFRRRLPQEEASIPERIGNFEYYMRHPPGANFPVYFRRRLVGVGVGVGGEKEEQVVLDQNKNPMLHQDFHFILGMKISPDENQLLLVQENAHEEYRLVLVRLGESGGGERKLFGLGLTTKKKKKNVPKKIQVLEHLGQVRNVEWCSDRAFYFTCVDHQRRPYAVYRYNLETAELVKVFEEQDEAFFVDVSSTKDNAFVLINCNSKAASEIHVLPCGPGHDTGPVSPILLRARETGTSYFADHARGRFLIVTNADGTTNYKISVCDDPPHHENQWRTLVPEAVDVKIDDVDVYEDHLVIYERVQSVPRIRVCDLTSEDPVATAHVVPLPSQHALCRITPGVNRAHTSSQLRFSISTPFVPEIVYDYDLRTRALTVLKETRVVDGRKRLDKEERVLGLDVDQFQCRREFVTSYDGQRVPLTLLHKRDLLLPSASTGDHPTLMLGYGAYGTNVEADFELEHISLLERGWVIAMAHVRGGGELGLHWYHAGRRQHKLNTFHDFVACAEYVLHQNYTCPERLAAKGVSAGGLIMGYIANEHPELFKALVLKVPFVDILDSMRDPTLPLTVHEYDEWGNPAEDAVATYMAQYAPCDNLRQGHKYPSMLVTASMNDIRVPYWGPVKWINRLRTLHAAENRSPPLLVLKMSEDDGHFGGGGRLEQFQETAMEYAFLYHALGLKFDQ